MSTSENPAAPEKEQGFLAHLYELRDRLLRIVLSVGILFVILMPFAQDLFNILAAPLASQMPEGDKLISIRPAGPFLVPFKLALMVAFLVALPYVLYQIWGFIAPGLYKHEKRLAVPLLVSSTLLFYAGIAFAYFVLLPLIFNILPQFVPDVAVYAPDIGHYMDFVMTLFMAFGIGFEMPVATILLITTGMATREGLAKKRPYVIVGAFIIGMLLTPPDVISQLLLAVPMWLLFEVGLIASSLFKKYIERSREERERAAKDEENSIMPPAATSAAGAAAATAASSTTAEDVVDDIDDDLAEERANATWEDDSYIFEETGDIQEPEDEDYKPMSEEEMEAEMERIEQELEDLAKDDDDKKSS